MKNIQKLAAFLLTGSAVFVIGCGTNAVMGTAEQETSESAMIIYLDPEPPVDSLVLKLPIIDYAIIETNESVNRITSVNLPLSGVISETDEPISTKTPPPSEAQPIAAQPVPQDIKSTALPVPEAAEPISSEVVVASTAKVTDNLQSFLLPGGPQVDSLCLDCSPIYPFIW
jgi:hypothetical protein